MIFCAQLGICSSAILTASSLLAALPGRQREVEGRRVNVRDRLDEVDPIELVVLGHGLVQVVDAEGRRGNPDHPLGVDLVLLRFVVALQPQTPLLVWDGSQRRPGHDRPPAGGGAVSATVSGKRVLTELVIDPDAVDPEDVEMLQYMIIAAVNGALNACETASNESMSKLTGGFNLGF